MLRVLVLAAESSIDPIDGGYPTFLSEIKNKTLLQHWVDHASTLDANLSLAVSAIDAKQFKLEQLVNLNHLNLDVYQLFGKTAGASCTALLATDSFAQEDELLILNGNEYLEFDFAKIINKFKMTQAGAGLVYFNSAHPRYSFVKLDSSNFVTEAAEKTPISNHATIGFYWFSSMEMFRNAAMMQIKKRSSYQDKYFICPSFNELILKGILVSAVEISPSEFKSLKTQRQALS